MPSQDNGVAEEAPEQGAFAAGDGLATGLSDLPWGPDLIRWGSGEWTGGCKNWFVPLQSKIWYGNNSQ